MFAIALAIGIAACGDRVTPPPRSLDLPDFYAKYVNVDGLPIIGSSRVPDRALFAAEDIIRHMLARRPDVLHQLADVRVRVAVMAVAESTTDIPEHSDLVPPGYWNVRARGLGATAERRVCSAAEENLLAYPDDPYRGKIILVHEFAHTVHIMALTYLDPGFNDRLRAMYRSAMDRGLYAHTYAATNKEEYWAVGVHTWFGGNLESAPSGIPEAVHTRDELEVYDPALAGLIRSVFGDVGAVPIPPPTPRHALAEK